MKENSKEFISSKNLQKVVFEYADGVAVLKGEQMKKFLAFINEVQETPEIQVDVWANKLEYMLEGLSVHYIQHVQAKQAAIKAAQEAKDKEEGNEVDDNVKEMYEEKEEGSE